MTFFAASRAASIQLNRVTSQPSSAKEPDSNVVELRSQIARLHMQVQTLARLLIAKGVMDEKELDEWMNYVDSLDGVADGRLRIARKPQTCPSCNRANPPQAAKCQWCGEGLTSGFLDSADGQPTET